jgi:hypothetical protein
MRIKFKSHREGPVPMEAVVTISTARGRNEEVIVHRSQIDERGIEVYYIGEGTACFWSKFRAKACLGMSASGFQNQS